MQYQTEGAAAACQNENTKPFVHLKLFVSLLIASLLFQSASELLVLRFDPL